MDPPVKPARKPLVLSADAPAFSPSFSTVAHVAEVRNAAIAAEQQRRQVARAAEAGIWRGRIPRPNARAPGPRDGVTAASAAPSGAAAQPAPPSGADVDAHVMVDAAGGPLAASPAPAPPSALTATAKALEQYTGAAAAATPAPPATASRTPAAVLNPLDRFRMSIRSSVARGQKRASAAATAAASSSAGHAATVTHAPAAAAGGGVFVGAPQPSAAARSTPPRAGAADSAVHRATLPPASRLVAPPTGGGGGSSGLRRAVPYYLYSHSDESVNAAGASSAGTSTSASAVGGAVRGVPAHGSAPAAAGPLSSGSAGGTRDSAGTGGGSAAHKPPASAAASLPHAPVSSPLRPLCACQQQPSSLVDRSLRRTLLHDAIALVSMHWQRAIAQAPEAREPVSLPPATLPPPQQQPQASHAAAEAATDPAAALAAAFRAALQAATASTGSSGGGAGGAAPASAGSPVATSPETAAPAPLGSISQLSHAPACPLAGSFVLGAAVELGVFLLRRWLQVTSARDWRSALLARDAHGDRPLHTCIRAAAAAELFLHAIGRDSRAEAAVTRALNDIRATAAALVAAVPDRGALLLANTAGQTTLHTAAACMAIEVMPQLLSRGLSVAARDNAGYQPLHYALMAAPLWLHHARAVCVSPESTPPTLTTSVADRWLQSVRLLLEGGASVHADADTGVSCVVLAAAAYQAVLLDADAAPLQRACKIIMRLLLQWGAPLVHRFGREAHAAAATAGATPGQGRKLASPSASAVSELDTAVPPIVRQLQRFPAAVAPTAPGTGSGGHASAGELFPTMAAIDDAIASTGLTGRAARALKGLITQRVEDKKATSSPPAGSGAGKRSPTASGPAEPAATSAKSPDAAVAAPHRVVIPVVAAPRLPMLGGLVGPDALAAEGVDASFARGSPDDNGSALHEIVRAGWVPAATVLMRQALVLVVRHGDGSARADRTADDDDEDDEDAADAEFGGVAAVTYSSERAVARRNAVRSLMFQLLTAPDLSSKGRGDTLLHAFIRGGARAAWRDDSSATACVSQFAALLHLAVLTGVDPAACLATPNRDGASVLHLAACCSVLSHRFAAVQAMGGRSAAAAAALPHTAVVDGSDGDAAASFRTELRRFAGEVHCAGFQTAAATNRLLATLPDFTADSGRSPPSTGDGDAADAQVAHRMHASFVGAWSSLQARSYPAGGAAGSSRFDLRAGSMQQHGSSLSPLLCQCILRWTTNASALAYHSAVTAASGSLPQPLVMALSAGDLDAAGVMLAHGATLCSESSRLIGHVSSAMQVPEAVAFPLVAHASAWPVPCAPHAWLQPVKHRRANHLRVHLARLVLAAALLARDARDSSVADSSSKSSGGMHGRLFGGLETGTLLHLLTSANVMDTAADGPLLGASASPDVCLSADTRCTCFGAATVDAAAAEACSGVHGWLDAAELHSEAYGIGVELGGDEPFVADDSDGGDSRASAYAVQTWTPQRVDPAPGTPAGAAASSVAVPCAVDLRGRASTGTGIRAHGAVLAAGSDMLRTLQTTQVGAVVDAVDTPVAVDGDGGVRRISCPTTSRAAVRLAACVLYVGSVPDFAVPGGGGHICDQDADAVACALCALREYCGDLVVRLVGPAAITHHDVALSVPLPPAALLLADAWCLLHSWAAPVACAAVEQGLVAVLRAAICRADMLAWASLWRWMAGFQSPAYHEMEFTTLPVAYVSSLVQPMVTPAGIAYFPGRALAAALQQEYARGSDVVLAHFPAADGGGWPIVVRSIEGCGLTASDLPHHLPAAVAADRAPVGRPSLPTASDAAAISSRFTAYVSELRPAGVDAPALVADVCGTAEFLGGLHPPAPTADAEALPRLASSAKELSSRLVEQRRVDRGELPSFDTPSAALAAVLSASDCIALLAVPAHAPDELPITYSGMWDVAHPTAAALQRTPAAALLHSEAARLHASFAVPGTASPTLSSAPECHRLLVNAQLRDMLDRGQLVDAHVVVRAGEASSPGCVAAGPSAACCALPLHRAVLAAHGVSAPLGRISVELPLVRGDCLAHPRDDGAQVLLQHHMAAALARIRAYLYGDVGALYTAEHAQPASSSLSRDSGSGDSCSLSGPTPAGHVTTTTSSHACCVACCTAALPPAMVQVLLAAAIADRLGLHAALLHCQCSVARMCESLPLHVVAVREAFGAAGAAATVPASASMSRDVRHVADCVGVAACALAAVHGLANAAVGSASPQRWGLLADTVRVGLLRHASRLLELLPGRNVLVASHATMPPAIGWEALCALPADAVRGDGALTAVSSPAAAGAASAPSACVGGGSGAVGLVSLHVATGTSPVAAPIGAGSELVSAQLAVTRLVRWTLATARG